VVYVYKQGKQVAVIELSIVVVATYHIGTIQSKTLLYAILYVTGFNERSFYGQHSRLRELISREEIATRVRMIVTRETHLVRSQFNRNRVVELDGTARFLDPHTLEIANPGGRTTTVRGDYVLIACGTRPAQSASIPV